MQRYRLPLTREVPIPSDEEALLPQPIEYYYLASDVDARIAELERRISDLEEEKRDAYSDGYSDGREAAESDH